MAKKRTRRPVDPVKKIRAKIERERKKAQTKRLNFTAPTDEQLRRKLGKIDSPMIVFQGWSGSAPPGGTINYTVGIHNPDPFNRIWLFAHLFVGPANFVRQPGRAVQAVDPRFPRLAMPDFPGLSIASGASANLAFNIDVPAGIEPSNYLGNTFLFQADWHDVGDYFDRSIFVFEVT